MRASAGRAFGQNPFASLICAWSGFANIVRKCLNRPGMILFGVKSRALYAYRHHQVA